MRPGLGLAASSSQQGAATHPPPRPRPSGSQLREITSTDLAAQVLRVIADDVVPAAR